LSLTVETARPQRFYAGFTLTGDAGAGQLDLTSPLGSTLAALRWQPGSATLIQGDQAQAYPSLDALTQRVTGAPIPVRALFDWLRGQNTPLDGWQADLSALAQGRLSAQRLYPAPAAQLRIVLDR
jgi:outer membrane lipoprotein LolB